MSLPNVFPIYADNLLTGPYHVSLSLPGINSEISKSIGITGSTNFLIPNSDYLYKFISGDIGIGDNILKETILSNFNSKEAKRNENVFKTYAKLNKIEIEDINRYKVNGEYRLSKEDINLSSEQDSSGIKSTEKTLLKSIFETQKPYIEISKLIIENLAKIEDIIARVMPLTSINPLDAKSEKPTLNGGSNGRPKSLGYKNAEELKNKLSDIESILSTNTQENVNSNISDNVSISNGTWRVISTIYSTGKFIPNINYQYTYIDLPKDDTLDIKKSNLDLNEDDLFKKYKPKTIVLGIFDSKGNAINPNEKLKSYDNSGNISYTNYNKAQWLLNSSKWRFKNSEYKWPSFGEPIYIWERGLITRESKDNPDSNASNPVWLIKKYKQGDKNIINKNDAIPNDPMIVKFETVEENEYQLYFKDLVDFRLSTKNDLTQEYKIESSNTILSQLDTRSHLENIFLYGQSKASIYNSVNGMEAFPDILKKSFKPYQIYVPESLNDPDIKKYYESNGKEPGLIWIDPEIDYLTKIIRIDPTTKIKYKSPEGENIIETEIKSFVKNINSFKLSDNSEFSIEIKKSSGNDFIDFISLDGITSYDLENWNYNDLDGLTSKFGVVNQAPTKDNTISYKISIWTKSANKKYNNGNYYSWMDNMDFIEIEKRGEVWSYNRFSFENTINDLKLNSSLLGDLYKKYKQNNTAVYSYGNNTISLSEVFSKKIDKYSVGMIKIDENITVYVKNGIITKWMSLLIDNIYFDINNLSDNGIKRVHSINVTTDNYTITTSDNTIEQFQIKVQDNFNKGKIIDPSKILNEQLSTPTKFSNGKYGYGSTNSPQDIEIIQRYMLTELDTESYYIIEGILPEIEKTKLNNTSINNDDDRWYKLPHAIGAVKSFINLLVDIFSKLIPNMRDLIKLFKSPANFITSIISAKMSEGFSFLSKDSLSKFKSFKDTENSSGLNDKYKQKKDSKVLKNNIKNSNLSNYIHVSDIGKITSLLDGVSTLPFNIFGKEILIGMSLDLNNILEKTPIGIANEKDFNSKNTKNLQEKLLSTNNKEVKVNLNSNLGIVFEDGSSISLEESKLKEFILDNETRYNFIYADSDLERELKESTDLINSGSEFELLKAKSKLENLKKNYNNDDIDNKINLANNKLKKLKSSDQPFLKLIMGIVTLPIKIIGAMLEWIINFFKSLSNPIKLPSKIKELLSFDWLMDLLSTAGILNMSGMKINSSKITEWKSKSNQKDSSKTKIPKSLKLPADSKLKGFNPKKIKSIGYSFNDEKIVNVNEYLNISFLVNSPVLSALQFRQNPNSLEESPSGFLCFIEKIINSIIDFIWSTLGIESVKKPPHIRLCSKKSNEETTTILSNIDSSNNLDAFVYEVSLPNGDIKNFLNRDELDRFIKDNDDFQYNFNF